MINPMVKGVFFLIFCSLSSRFRFILYFSFKFSCHSFTLYLLSLFGSYCWRSRHSHSRRICSTFSNNLIQSRFQVQMRLLLQTRFSSNLIQYRLQLRVRLLLQARFSSNLIQFRFQRKLRLLLQAGFSSNLIQLYSS